MFTKTLKLLVLVGALAFSYKSFAQPTFTVQNVKGSCEGFPNGSFDVLVNSASGSVNLFYFSGPLFGGPFPATVGTPVTIPGLAGSPFPGRVYQLVVQDAVDFSTTNVNIISYPTPLAITIDNVSDNSDCITSNGSISVTPSGGSGSFTFAWTEASSAFTATTEDISNLLGGSYSLTVTDNNTHCVETFPPIVVNNPSPIQYQVDVTPNPLPVCSGSDLVISLDGSEVGASYEVIRNNVIATGITLVGTGSPLNFTVPAGTFSNGDNFKITATNGICEGDMQGALIVSILPLPTASIAGTATICSGGSTNLTFTLPAGTYNIVYTDGTTNFNANGISNGATVSVSPTANVTYTIVSVTNTVTSCTSTAPSPNITGSAVITVNPLPTASIAGTAMICAGGSTLLTFTLPSPGTFNVVYTDGTSNFNANGIANGATVSVNPSVNTTYTIVSVTDVATSCSVTAPSPNITGSAVVTVNPLPTASISGTITICSGNNAVLTFTLSAGTYDVVYTNGTTNFTLNGIVSGATVNVSPTANTTYTIVSIANTSIASCAVTAPSPNITGSAIVTVNPTPTASISGTTAICNGTNAVLTFTLPATGTFNVVYTDGTTNFNALGISNGATVNVNPATNTTYTIVSVTNTATSCSATAPSPNITGSAVVTVNPLPTASIAGNATICSGNSTNLTFTLPATGTFNVVYTDGTTNFNANGISNGATVSVSPTANTTYTIVSVTDAASSCAVTAPNPNITGSAVITVNPSPVANIAGTTTVCSGTGATLTFTLSAGTYDVVYTDGTTNFPLTGISNGATVNVTPTVNSTYTIVSVTNTATSCSVTAPSPNITGSAVVTVNPLPTASISGTAAICAGGTAALTFTLPAPGTFNVVYTDGTTNFNANGISNGATVNVNPAANTTYTIVSVTNTVTTCAVTAPSPNITGSAVVTVSPLPTASISGTATICAGASTALSFTLPAGTFNVVYTDGTTNFNANGISNGATVNVSPAANTTYTIVSVTNTVTTCAVTAPSANITGSAVISVNPLPVASITGTATICAGVSTALTFNLSAGTFNVVYTDGTTNFNANGITNGAIVNVSPTTTTTYTIVSVTNTASSCSVTAPNPNITGSAVVTVGTLPTANIAGTAAICTGASTPLTFTLPTGTFDVVYTDGTTNFNATGIANGATVNVSPATNTTYTIVSVTNPASGCAVTAPSPNITGSAVITVSPQPTIVGANTTPICQGTTPALLTYTSVTGGADQYSIDFNGAAQLQGFVDIFNQPLPASPISIPVLATALPGTYNGNLFVRNSASGCLSGPTPISITINPGPTATISGTTSICSGAQATITLSFTGTGPWSFVYSDGSSNTPGVTSLNPTTFNVTPTATTTYTLISVDDAGACNGTVSGSAVITVNQAPLANLAVDVTIDPLCSGGSTDVTVANSQVGVSYQLRNDAGDVLVGPAVNGTGGTINLPTGVLTATTTFNVLATAAGCTAVELTDLQTVTVGGAINASLSVSAAVSPLCSGNSTNIQVANSENGVLYQLRNDADDSDIGPVVAGNGGTINLPTGNLAATTAFNVLASNGTCSIQLTDIETVTVSPSPNASLAVTPTISTLCAGGSTTITVALSQSGISYQLRNDAGDVPVGSPIVGTGGTIAFPTGALGATTTFNVLATGAGCPPVELTNTATVTVSGSVDASLTVVAAASPICEGTGTNIQIALSETGVNYQLRNDATDAPVGVAVAGTGGTILLPTGNLAATTTFNVLASNGTCSIELADLETVNVDVAPDAALLVDTTLDPLCVGGVSGVTVELSQTGVTYQLRDDADDSNVGAAVIGTGGTITLPTGVLNATTVFNVLATSGSCPSVELTQTATVTVAGSLNAGLAVTSSASPICANTSTFIQVALSENGVNYQLRNDLNDAPIGLAVVGTGGTINIPTGNLLINTTFNIVASNGTCSIELTDKESVTVSPAPATNLTVNAASTLICSGASTNIVVVASESGVSYQLRNNVTPIGGPVVGTGGNIILPTGNLTANTTFNILATIGTCSAQLTATPTVTIRPIGDPACGGGGSDCTNFASIIPTIVSQPSCNDLDNGEVSFVVARADGTPTTFEIRWMIGGTTQAKITSGNATFNDLSAGAYTYTVIDLGNGKTCGPVDFFLDLQTKVEILDKQVTANVTCYGGTDGNAILSVDGSSTGEYWYKYVLDGVESSAQTFTPGAPLPGGLPADDDNLLIIKVDESFNFTCPDTVMVRIRHTFPKIDFTVTSTEVTTCNGTDGSIFVGSIAGGDSGTNPLQVRLKKAVPFSQDPSGYIVLIDFEDVVNGEKEFTDLSQGNYVVDVKDDLDCIQSKPIAVQAPGQVPLASVTITTSSNDACLNEDPNGSITVVISDAGQYEVAVSQDPLNVPADDQFVDYSSPSFPNVVFSGLTRGAYYLYIKSSTTTCPTRTDAINIDGFQGIGSFEVLSNCGNQNLTINNITGQVDAAFVIRVFDNDDKFFKIDSLTSSSIPLSKSVTFVYNPPLQHSFLSIPGTYRFVMVQTQTFGASSCVMASDTVVYDVQLGLSITLGEVKPSFPAPKRTGSIEVADIDGGSRFVSSTNELYYEVALYDADDDVVVEDWTEVKLDPQNKFKKVYEYLPPGVYRIKVRDASGCEKTIDAEITLDPTVYVPNVFTPNDDAVNDTFEILNLPLTGQHKLIVSNRWGNEVFKSNDYRDGNFWNANDTADGIYFYRLQVDGGDTYTGWVEIIRGNKP